MSKTMDWDAITIPEVTTVIDQVSRELARQYAGFVEFEDIRQEAYIKVAENGHRVRIQIEAGQVNYMANELRLDLINIFARQHMKYQDLTSIDAM